MINLTHLHPMIVHFPIALLLVGFVTDLAGLIFKNKLLTQTAFYLLILGALGTIAALLTGELAGDRIAAGHGLLKQAVEQHEESAELTIWLVGITAGARIVLVLLKKYVGIFKAAVLILFFASVLSVARTGYYGGKLVYEHAAGVQIDQGTDLNTTSGTVKDDDD